MLTLGIDVLILLMCASVLIVTSLVVSAFLQFTRRETDIAVNATAIATIAMLVSYVVMAEVLDFILGVA